ncbi:MAG TPA: glycine--tRNA ligase subunit beta, partial [Candidatus Acidoferrales bacterium]|nr:glycine--tRNA ligase subunit beta [Candidatus Acidoferrales bacterium]
MIEPACTHLKASLEKSLAEASLLFAASSISCFGGPRRITVIVPALLLKQADVVKEFTGPAKAGAYDAQGNPTRAAEGFAASKGVSVKDLYVVTLPKGEFIAARQTILGRPAAAVLAEILPRALAEIPWPKTMTWPAPGNPRFIRPVRWLLALLGGKVVPMEFAGAKSSDRTAGHRTLGKSAIRVSNSAWYRALLRKNFVLADPTERAKRIDRGIAELTHGTGFRAYKDLELLNRVAYLNEYPTVIMGSFDPTYLALPPEILITVMRDHQKYFAVQRKGGGLAPNFIAVINSDRDRAGKMRQG